MTSFCWSARSFFSASSRSNRSMNWRNSSARRACRAQRFRLRAGAIVRRPRRKPAMEILIWLGAALSLGGLVGLVWCIVTVWKARRAGQSDTDLRATIQRVVPLNTGALFLSVLGLMMVVVGIMLG